MAINIDEIKNLAEKFINNFQGSEDFEKIKANGEDLISTLGNLGGNSGLAGFAKSALGKLGVGDSGNGIVEKALSSLGNLAKTDAAKLDFSNLESAVKKFIGI